jgi:hypothetical protein
MKKSEIVHSILKELKSSVGNLKKAVNGSISTEQIVHDLVKSLGRYTQNLKKVLNSKTSGISREDEKERLYNAFDFADGAIFTLNKLSTKRLLSAILSENEKINIYNDYVKAKEYLLEAYSEIFKLQSYAKNPADINKCKEYENTLGKLIKTFNFIITKMK